MDRISALNRVNLRRYDEIITYNKLCNTIETQEDQDIHPDYLNGHSHLLKVIKVQ
jgi:hypothetical protein